MGSDIIGRQWAFNCTLAITGIWGTIAGSAPNFAAIATFAALWSVGVGGNLYLSITPAAVVILLVPWIRRCFSKFSLDRTSGC